MRYIIPAVVCLALIVWALSTTFYVVGPADVAVVRRGEKVVRIEQPGLRWHIPLVESVGLVPITRLYKQPVEVGTKLADGTDCRIAAFIFFRADDPVRVLAWRLKHGLDVSAGGMHDDGRVYTEAASTFKETAAAALPVITREAAQSGAVSAWINGYSAEEHADGTRTIRAQPQTVSCEPVVAAKKKHRRKSEPPVFGDIQPFARTVARPATPADKRHPFVVKRQELILAGRQRVLFEAFQVHYVVSNEARFMAVFGAGASGHKNVPPRVKTRLNAHLRRTVGAMDPSALRTFDPLSLAAQGTPLANKLEQFGIRIADVGGSKSGYRLSAARH